MPAVNQRRWMIKFALLAFFLDIVLIVGGGLLSNIRILIPTWVTLLVSVVLIGGGLALMWWRRQLVARDGEAAAAAKAERRRKTTR